MKPRACVVLISIAAILVSFSMNARFRTSAFGVLTLGAGLMAVWNMRVSLLSREAEDTEDAGIKPYYKAHVPKIDILSIGSVHRLDYLVTQQETFGSHHSVRNWFPLTEHNDTAESDCHTDLSSDYALRIASYCRRRIKNYPLLDAVKGLYMHTRQLKEKSNPAGWICAQKRPIQGLFNVLERYQRDGSEGALFPDYLIILDDDSYYDLDVIVPHLEQHYPVNEAHFAAGCLIRMSKVNFSKCFAGSTRVQLLFAS
jgi:hypothetical protein